jgi:hypothetical protein
MKPKQSDIRETRKLENITLREFIDSYIYRIDLDADYQREVIWSRKQQLELLDSIVRGIDIPKLYLVKVNNNKQYDFECIDGKQRMTSILNFIKPDSGDEAPLTVEVTGRNYTFEELKSKHPTIAKKQIEDYVLSFTIYEAFHDEGEFVRQIFRRLQLGVRLNSGELLKTQTGTIKEFIYKEIGSGGPFFRNTNLSLKRFSIPFTLAQICINSFSKANKDIFIRARYDDLSNFFEEYQDLNRKDDHLVRIKKVLQGMDKAFGIEAKAISSRAVAVTGYLFSEELVKNRKSNLLPKFAKFYISLLNEISENMESISKYQKPANPYILEGFQKYVTQASVEGYSINRRHKFLIKAFDHFLKTKKIIDRE